MRNRLITLAACGIAASALVLSGLPAAAHTTSAATSRTHPPFAVGAVRLDGAQETQAADPDGRGTFVYVAAKDQLCYLLTARKIEPATMAHIHPGVRGVAGGIAIGLEAPTDGLSFGCITAVSDDTPDSPTVLLQSELDAIIANPAGFYVNVHNTPFPAGAIRGQLR
jgi:hypothetical protein